jgi:hypothetical protein
MAGKVVVSTLNNDTGVLATQNGMTGIAKAWVNFNGTGTVAIRDSFNVSSITDNGTGRYTVNFTTALPNANYAFVGSVERDGVTGVSTINDWVGGTKTTSAFEISTQRSGSLTDYAFVCCAFFSS